MPNDVNTEIADSLTLHRLRLLRYEGGVARDMVGIYRSAVADLEQEIARLQAQVKAGGAGKIRLQRLQGIQIELRTTLKAAEERLAKTLAEATREAALKEAEQISAIMAKRLGRSWVQVPEDAVLRAAQGPVTAPWRNRLATDLNTLNDEVGAVVARGMARGASMDDIARMLRSVPGLTETYADRMVVIARTEVQRAANDVAFASYAANNDVIGSVQWLATLDSRTCLRCAPKHNRTYPLVGGRAPTLDRRPPLHPRCRCFLAPVTRGYAELGLPPTHANRTRFDGEPAREQTFDAWLRRQSVDVQTEVLGPGRLALFRAGHPLDDFVVGSQVVPLRQFQQLAAS